MYFVLYSARIGEQANKSTTQAFVSTADGDVSRCLHTPASHFAHRSPSPFERVMSHRRPEASGTAWTPCGYCSLLLIGAVMSSVLSTLDIAVKKSSVCSVRYAPRHTGGMLPVPDTSVSSERHRYRYRRYRYRLSYRYRTLR